MTPNRSDLDSHHHNSTYIFLTVILVILSLIGLYLIFNFPSKPQVVVKNTLPTDTPIPTQIEVPEITGSVTPVLSATPSAAPTPTPEIGFYQSDVDNFSVSYKTSRKLYQDKEITGNRYTFYSPQGNIAIHTGTQWSWTYPERTFTTDLIIAGQPTFVYQTDSQTITDFQVNSQKYTIQCVHNGVAELKSECDQFVTSFKLL